MKQVIVMRKDLNMRKGKMCAQAAHSSVQVVLMNHMYDDRIRHWLNEGMPKIVVGCNSEEELLQLVGKAREHGLMTELIRDAGKTEFKEPTFTCCAIGPEEDSKVDKITGELTLL